jgi:hypothetical protein
LAGFEQTPVLGLHVPAVWHWSGLGQTVGVPAEHTPAWQVSVVVQAFPSLHVVPFAFAGFEHTPVVGLQVPALWHWSVAPQVLAVPPHTPPALHTSLTVHGSPSSQAEPALFSA